MVNHVELRTDGGNQDDGGVVMTYQSTIQAFFGAGNDKSPIELEIDEKGVWIYQGGLFIECDRIAARTLANAILRELGKQS